jgi:hypothetical protein
VEDKMMFPNDEDIIRQQDIDLQATLYQSQAADKTMFPNDEDNTRKQDKE